MSTAANTFDTLKQQLTDLQGQVAKLGTDVTTAIDNLKAQIAAGTPVTQAQLDELSTMVSGISSQVTAEDAAVAPPAPTA